MSPAVSEGEGSLRTLAEAARRAQRFLQDAQARGGRGPCSQLQWRPSLPPARPFDFAFAAVDGGSAVLEGGDLTFYAVKAWAGLFKPASRGVEGEVRLASVGAVIPHQYAEERVGLYREVLEAEAALRVLPPEGGVMLMDGSIKPVARPARLGRLGRPTSGVVAEIVHRIGLLGEGGGLGELCPRQAYPCLKAFLEKPPLPRPASAELALRTLGVGGDDGVMEWVLALETLERLFLYQRLFTLALERGVWLVFVTKTSRQNSLCGGAFSDVHYIMSREPLRPGYAVWPGGVARGVVEVTGLEESSIGEHYLEALGLRSFYFDRLGLVEFYTRLTRGGPVLVVDVLVDGRRVPWDEEGRLQLALEVSREVLSRLKALPGSRSGYPSALYIAHHNARIGVDERRLLEDLLGVQAGLSGRGMLNP